MGPGLHSVGGAGRFCGLCKCNNSDVPWTGCAETSNWDPTVWDIAAYALGFPNRHKLFRQVPGLTMLAWIPDWLHTKHIGCDGFFPGDLRLASGFEWWDWNCLIIAAGLTAQMKGCSCYSHLFRTTQNVKYIFNSRNKWTLGNGGWSIFVVHPYYLVLLSWCWMYVSASY